MGRIYRSIIVQGRVKERLTVAFVDTGADETIISGQLARELDLELYGVYRAYSATNQVIEGQFAEITFRDEQMEITMEVGVTDIPFQSEISDEEGIDVILGVDFLQDAKVNLKFSR